MSATLTRTRRPALFMVAAFVAFVAAVSPLAAAGRAVVVVHPAKNAKLGKTILVNLHGHTLYQLSAEGGKKFICTDSKCLSVWHPISRRVRICTSHFFLKKSFAPEKGLKRAVRPARDPRSLRGVFASF